MDTPITLSSTSTDSVMPEVISLDTPKNSNSLRMSVSTITKSSGDISRPSSKTLSNLQKVTNWMNSFQNNSSFSSDELSEHIMERTNGSRPKGLMFLRYDFDKSKSPESCKSNEGKCNEKQRMYQNITIKKVRCDSDKSTTDGDNHCQEVKIRKSENGSLYEVPLSPDSHKKELYSYLQLMNPLDKKEIFILQNRRSSRVRNLEKKEQEKKNRELEDRALEDRALEDRELEDKNIQKNYLMLKSLKDLNITVRSMKNVEPKEKKRLFKFPSPTFIMNVMQDFDEMERLMRKYQKDIGRKIKDKPKIKKKKERRIMKNKENMKKLRRRGPPKKSIRALRSNTKISPKKFLKKQESIRAKKKEERSLQRKKFREKIDEKRLKASSEPIRSQITPKPPETQPDTTETHKTTPNNQQLEDINLQYFLDSSDFNSLTEEHKKSLIEARLLLPKPATTIQMPKPIQKPFNPGDTLPVKAEIDNLVDIQNFVDDMMDFKNLSEEHKKCLIETRIMTSSSKSLSSSLSPFYGYSPNEINKFKAMCEKNIVSTTTVDETEKTEREKRTVASPRKSQTPSKKNVTSETFETESTHSNEVTTNGINYQEKESGYGDSDRSKTPQKRDSKDSESCVITPFNKNTTEMKSLHRSLCSKRKLQNNTADLSPRHTFLPEKQKKSQHSIYLEREDGPIIKAFYLDYNLIICQESLVSFYTQTALGNVLGAQNMWIPKGSTRRLTLSNKCIQKESMEMVISMENNIVYIELWTKEHKSDIRANPVADVFVTIYFWKQRQAGLEKKVLQLENITGFADDVQYSVLKYSPTIVVCWHGASNELEERKTYIHSYQLAEDYQTVGNISELEPVGHYVSSLHNIEDCENLIMGCGENKITLWNLEYGYIVATIELNDIKSPLCTLWVKCDRGFLFTLQQCVDKELRLIAINGINHSWKKLASYTPPKGFDRLRGVCVENGMIVSFYDRGIICWNAQTGEPVVEETQSEIEYIPSQKYVIMLVNDQVVVKHAVTHLVSPEGV